MKNFLLIPLALIGAASLSSAAITLTNSLSAESAGTANGANVEITVTGFDLTGGNTVAVFFTAENSSAFTATFDGVAMNVVQAFDGDRFLAGVAYLINPTASVGDIVINATNSGTNRLSNGYSVISLADVASLAGSAIRTSNGTLSYTTALDGGYVLGASVNNSYNGSTLPSVSGRPSAFFNQAVDSNATVLHARGDVPTAGAYSDTYGGGILAAATVAFNPVPEPSAALLSALGFLALLRRRR